MLNIAQFVKLKHIGGKISDITDGDMGLTGDESLLKDKQSNRAKYLAKGGISISNTVIAGLNHGAGVALVGKHDVQTIIPETDGLVTFDKNIALAVTTADCLPIYFFRSDVVGILHAGWRGLAANIIEEMARTFDSVMVDPRSVHVVIGPHICTKHYDVGTDLIEEFKTYGAVEDIDGKSCLNLSKIAIIQLRQAGFAHIKDVNICTFEGDYFSARRDGAPLRTQLATVELKNAPK
jgi:hypothetical protein